MRLPPDELTILARAVRSSARLRVVLTYGASLPERRRGWFGMRSRLLSHADRSALRMSWLKRGISGRTSAALSGAPAN